MKKLLLTTALVAATATAAVADGSNFNVALYGGYVGSSTTLNYNLQGGVNGGKADLGGNGGTVGLALAYDHIMSSGLVLGADVFGSWHRHEAKYSATLGINRDFESELRYSFGTALKCGYMFDKTMAFFKVGYINSRFEFKGTNNTTAGTPSVTKKKNLSGLLVGLGIDLPVGSKMAVGLSYDFAYYKNQSISAANVADRANFKPRMHFVNIALKYKF